MRHVALVATIVLALSVPVSAAPAAAPTDVSAQSRPKKRPQIRVTPLRSRELGPNAKRACTFRLVEERRPSGTVVVPRTYCWWVRG